MRRPFTSIETQGFSASVLGPAKVFAVPVVASIWIAWPHQVSWRGVEIVCFTWSVFANLFVHIVSLFCLDPTSDVWMVANGVVAKHTTLMVVARELGLY